MRKKLHDKKTLFIVIAIVLAIGIIVVPTAGKTITFDIPDKCGRFVNLISHTIETANKCDIRCEQQCDAKDLAFKESTFVESEAGGCHTCTCACTEGGFGFP